MGVLMGKSADAISRSITAVFALSAALFLSACGPKDQEECVAQVAKDAKSVAAMQVLANDCQRKFPAKLRDDGSYAYYDSELDDWVSVSGPKLSSTDVEKIRQLRTDKQNAQAEADKLRQEVLSKIKISSYSVTCNIDSSYISCYDKNITINLKNNSNKTIHGITLDYEIGSKINCTGSLGKSFSTPISISPGGVGSIVQNVKFEEAGPDGEMRGCVRVGGVGQVE